LEHSETVATRIRPATAGDAEGINQVHKRNGMPGTNAGQWLSGFESYPFAGEFRDIPTGWVLETQAGDVAGAIGNVHLLYELDGRPVKAAIATAWAVDPAYRGRSLHLTTTFFKQKGLDLLLNGSANPTASKVLAGLQIPRMPIPDYSSPCFWAADARAFAEAVLRRRGAPWASAASYPVGLMLYAASVLRGSGRGKPSGPVRRLEGFDVRFDALWNRIAAGPSRLRAVRTQSVLKWKFRADLDAGRAAVLATDSGGELSGYAVLLRRPGSDLGMSLYDIADFQAAGDDPAVFRDLLLGAVRLAREEGIDAVKLLTGTPAKRAPAMALRPFTYPVPFWQLYYRASPQLKQALARADAWDFSLFDTY
jgi:hypothetical protein